MNPVTFVLLLLWTSGTNPASTVDLRSPEDTVHNDTTGTSCGVPAIKPKVPGCLSDGLSIVNGEEALPHSWPWQVSLQDNTGWHNCGGSLIGRNWVVTAAHCNISESHRAILGLHNRKNTNNVQTMRIGKVFNHPDYSRTTLDNDIALIKLQSPAQMNDHVSPVCVAEACDKFHGGMKCVATGWGRTRYEPREAPLKLQQVCLPLISNDQCKSKYWGSSITDQMHCAGAAGSVICQGDSGGPLVCMKNGVWTLVGVSSFVARGCKTNMPGVFASVPNLRAWMDRTIADN